MTVRAEAPKFRTRRASERLSQQRLLALRVLIGGAYSRTVSQSAYQNRERQRPARRGTRPRHAALRLRSGFC